ncbi:MAG: hypothetical protein GY859_28815 [Desulfobacterales bacterium]|nr:hypothetical protein [Desulfobacterales bacterium]
MRTAQIAREPFMNRIKQLERKIARGREVIAAIEREKLFSVKAPDSLPGIFYLYTGNNHCNHGGKYAQSCHYP